MMGMQQQPQESFNLCWVSETQYKTYSCSVVHTVYITTSHKGVAEWSKLVTAPRFAMSALLRLPSMFPGTLFTE